MQDEGGPASHGGFGFLYVNDVFAILVAGEGSVVLQVVKAHHVGYAVCLGGTEAHTAQDAGNEGDESVLLGAVGDFAHLDEVRGEEQTADVGLGLFPCAVLAAEGFAEALAVGDGLFDA